MNKPFYSKICASKIVQIRTHVTAIFVDNVNVAHLLIGWFQTFMTWKLPKRPATEQPGSEWAAQLTDEMFDRVIRGKLTSTYQEDYLGIPQGKHLFTELIPLNPCQLSCIYRRRKCMRTRSMRVRRDIWQLYSILAIQFIVNMFIIHVGYIILL